MESTQKQMRAQDKDYLMARVTADQITNLLKPFIPDACYREAWEVVAEACFKEGMELTSKRMRKEYEAWKEQIVSLGQSFP